MGALIVAVLLVALGVVDLRRNRIGDDAVIVDGTVTEVVAERSKTAGRRDLMYGSVVEYRHPETGRLVELAPHSFGKRVHEVGDTVQVALRPNDGQARVVRRHPWKGFAVLLTLGLIMLGLQIAQWAS